MAVRAGWPGSRHAGKDIRLDPGVLQDPRKSGSNHRVSVRDEDARWHLLWIHPRTSSTCWGPIRFIPETAREFPSPIGSSTFVEDLIAALRAPVRKRKPPRQLSH